jgi:predicted sugar kinase
LLAPEIFDKFKQASKTKVDDLCDSLLQFILFDLINNNIDVFINKNKINMSYPSHCKNCSQIFTTDIIDEIIEIKQQDKTDYTTVIDKYEFGLCC